MINHDKKFIFVHIPRCAGNFINDFFDSDWIEKIRSDTGTFKDVNNYNIDHYPLYRYKELHPDKYNAYFKFTFVRNPWERMLSEFFLKKFGKSRGCRWGPINDFIDCSQLEFCEFIRKLQDKFHLIEELMHTNHNDVCHFMSYKHYIENPKNLDFVGKLENFSTDFCALCKNFFIEYSPKPKINQANHLHYSEYYSPKTRDIVGELYSWDIKKFNYKFES